MTVRTSQLILTYGVGSLVAVGEESFIVTGLDHWDVEEDDELHEPRLERLLWVNRSTGEGRRQELGRAGQAVSCVVPVPGL